MEVLYWVFIAIVVIAVLFGLKSLIVLILTIFAGDGVKAGVFTTVFFILLLSPGIVKYLAPEYWGYSIWALILYVGGFLVYRHMIAGTQNEKKEG